MSLSLSVLVDKKLTEPQMQSVHDFLNANGFYKDQCGYRSSAVDIFLDVYPESDPERDDFWTVDLPRVVPFFPKTDIGLESRHNRVSHEMNYRIAKQLAEVVSGVIYNDQLGKVYDSSGMPLEHCRESNHFDEYGAGIDFFMKAVGTFGDIIGQKI